MSHTMCIADIEKTSRGIEHVFLNVAKAQPDIAPWDSVMCCDSAMREICYEIHGAVEKVLNECDYCGRTVLITTLG